MLKKIIYILALVFFVTSCADTFDSVKRGLTGQKQQSTDEFLIKKKVIHAYAILVEANGKTVAQAEHTFIPTQSGVTVTTIG